MDGFLRSRKTARSQDRERAGMQGAAQSAVQGGMQATVQDVAQGAEQDGSQAGTPGTPTAEQETGVSANAVERTHDMAKELYSLVMSKHNILGTVKEMQAKLTAMAQRAVQEHRRLLQRAEQAEQELEAAATQAKELQARAEAAEAMAVAAEAMAAETEARAAEAEKRAAEAEKRADVAQSARAEAMMATPAIDLATPKARMEKRKRETPGEEEEKKKPRGPEGSPDAEGEEGWQTVPVRVRKGPTKPAEGAKTGPKMPAKQRPVERARGDAIRVEMKGITYADLLRKITSDPALEAMEMEVVRTRTTRKGDMLIELRAGAKVPTMELRSMVQKSLGQEEGVKALSHDTAIECRNLDSITTESELEKALKEQCGVKEISSLRLRKGFDNMKVATVWLHPQEAGKLLAKGSVKLRWSVCPIRVAPRVDPSTRKCYKCLELGHLSVNCKGPDRSKLCYNCGGEGHALGGPRCNAYRSRAATKQ
ncbi:tol-Pal system protein TolA-like [Anopheles darlingi]|uniref:tol-Pal system protein TolA-like n=1 Tax=Anopheles darlingi TaxID=43151 RepID=UPI0021001693|nr:tol-Pal system protein TolA-like [Anopheles darlingi]